MQARNGVATSMGVSRSRKLRAPVSNQGMVSGGGLSLNSSNRSR